MKSQILQRFAFVVVVAPACAERSQGRFGTFRSNFVLFWDEHGPNRVVPKQLKM